MKTGGKKTSSKSKHKVRIHDLAVKKAAEVKGGVKVVADPGTTLSDRDLRNLYK